MADQNPITLLPSLVGADPVAAPLRDVAALFADELSDVRFPDLDAKILNAAIGDVEKAFAEVARLEAVVTEARRKLDESHDVLVHKAARGLAYARVFADSDAELLARLDAITLPRSRRGGAALVPAADAPKKRGRKPNAPAETLFNGSSSANDSTLPSDTSVDIDDVVAHAAE